MGVVRSGVLLFIDPDSCERNREYDCRDEIQRLDLGFDETLTPEVFDILPVIDSARLKYFSVNLHHNFVAEPV